VTDEDRNFVLGNANKLLDLENKKKGLF